MKRWISRCVWFAVVCSMSLGCGPTESGDAEPGQVADHRVDETTDEQSQPLEHNRKHWMVAGAGSRAETVAGSDGHPAQISGRFLNAGAGIDHGSLGKEKWLIGSDSGYVQLLKKSGQRT
ncbi:MAG: hypothetical protein ABEN55_19450, partial [Bradymonadaceae bacterium]